MTTPIIMGLMQITTYCFVVVFDNNKEPSFHTDIIALNGLVCQCAFKHPFIHSLQLPFWVGEFMSSHDVIIIRGVVPLFLHSANVVRPDAARAFPEVLLEP